MQVQSSGLPGTAAIPGFAVWSMGPMCSMDVVHISRAGPITHA